MNPDPADLWLLPERAVDTFAGALGGTRLLTEEERARLRRLRGQGARRRFLGARTLARYALSARSGRPVHAWRFRPGPWGRPEPEPPCEGLRFNLSHTEGLIACLVTRGRACGVDVERAPASPDALTHLVPRLAEPERAELAALPPAARADRFSELWVLKEAYLKALGTGVTRELSGFSFTTPPTGPIAVRDPRRPSGAADAWWFRLLRPAPGYVLAVAAEHGRPAHLHRIDLADLADPGEASAA
ncbi:4'-phosphopantetheinyl transferase family protein [Streptomyces sennicomposti]|uniref:4'-phosphopantetheinyl transferase family protein n=1 Tax=Streptomyces TaxID=1883 RepID=UPI001CA6582B|nr:4'-phosphopantetheinyl transferase superfamily protein [Streptomyces sennicomposti]MBY8869550.1 4'-phosphopantetheinyl transferase superfamily protein [Streptomyces sennicomposti]